MKNSKQDRVKAAVGLYQPRRLLNAEAYKRKTRRMYSMCMSSLIAILTCITMTVSTTWAWFYANLRTKENIIQIASFNASANLSLTGSIDPTIIVMDADTFAQQAEQAMFLSNPYGLRTSPVADTTEGESDIPNEEAIANEAGNVAVLTEAELEEALTLPDGAYASGTYEMNIAYSGTTGGYCTFTVMPASAWSTTEETATYFVALPSTNGADESVSVSLTLNEPAYVNVETNWGVPGTSVEYVDSDGVSFGEVMVLKVLRPGSGDTVYGMDDDTTLVPGVVAPGDTVYGMDDDTTLIPGIVTPGDSAKPGDTVYDVADDTEIISGVVPPGTSGDENGAPTEPAIPTEPYEPYDPAAPIIPDDEEDEEDDESDTTDDPPGERPDDTVYSISDDTVIIQLTSK